MRRRQISDVCRVGAWKGHLVKLLQGRTGRLLRRQVKQALFLWAPFLYKSGNCLHFFKSHSHASTNATRHHEYSRVLSRLLSVPGVLLSFLKLGFGGKMALLALGGRPQPLKKPFQSQKGHFYEKINALNDTKTSKLSKSEEGNEEYL